MPGFIDLTLKLTGWIDALRTVLEQGADYGRSDIGKVEPVKSYCQMLVTGGIRRQRLELAM